MKNEIVIFDNQNVKLEVNVKDDTVWLSTSQMAQLFDKEESNIRRHIINIFKDRELEKDYNVQKMHVDGVKQKVPFYSLDMIISVGYRVKSQNGIVFRRWANKVLKEYLLNGYAINQKRLEYLEKTVKLLNIANRSQDRIANEEIKDVLNVINTYSKALDLLDDYDHRKLKKISGIKTDIIITYDECLKIIEKLKFNNESNLFALERDNDFKSIINDIMVHLMERIFILLSKKNVRMYYI